MSESAIRLEICVDSPKGLEAAIEGGADRIELCAALSVGGLTPSAGLMRLASRSPVPVHALVRPRAGSFMFHGAEIEAMRADIALAGEIGLRGVVLGASRPDLALDTDALALLLREAGPLGCTLHRAFDLVPDRWAALETAVDLGFERILTSGGARSAEAGAAALAALVAQAGTRISVMPGAGVSPDNAGAIIRRTGAKEIHASARAAQPSDPRLAAFGFAESEAKETSAATVRAIRRALGKG